MTAGGDDAPRTTAPDSDAAPVDSTGGANIAASAGNGPAVDAGPIGRGRLGRRGQRRLKKAFETREHRRRRMRRHGRRAYIRSVYFLPSMATLGIAVRG